MLRYTDPDVTPANTIAPGPDCHHITHVYVGLVDDPEGPAFRPHECGHESLAFFYSERSGARRLDKKHGLEFSGDAESARRIYRDDFHSDDIPMYRLARCETGEAFKTELGLVLKEYPELQTEDPGDLLANKMPDFFPDDFSGGPLPDLTALYRRGTPEEFDWMAEHFVIVSPSDEVYEAWKLSLEFGVVVANLQSATFYIVYRLDDPNGEAMAKSVAEEYGLIDDGYVFGQILGVLDHPDEAVFEANGLTKPPCLSEDWNSCWGYIGRPKDLRPDLYAAARGALRRRDYLPEDVRVIDERGKDITAEVLAGYEAPPVEPPTPGLDFDAPEMWDSGGLCQSP